MTARSKKQQESREMFVRTRRQWKDGSKIEIEFTSKVSVNGKVDHISNHTVTLRTGNDTCSCMGYASSERKYALEEEPGHGTCCHIEYFRGVENMRRRLVVAEQSVQRIESVVALLNLTTGKQVVMIGASSLKVPVKFIEDTKPLRSIETTALGGPSVPMGVNTGIVTTRKVNSRVLGLAS